MTTRRKFLAAGAAGVGIVAIGGPFWLAGPRTRIEGFEDLAAARHWLLQLRATPHRSIAQWPFAQVLEHLAQSIHCSIDGYPQLRAPWVRRTIGPFAFTVFARRGRMMHDTAEPIPGAPALQLENVSAAIDALGTALTRFETMPADHRFATHFAYGELTREDYLAAHLMHLADHAREIVPSRVPA